MNKEDVVNSVVRSQAKMIELKEEEIAKLKIELKNKTIASEALQRRLDMHMFQIVVDEIYDRACRVVEVRLKSMLDGKDYRGDLMLVREGDTVNVGMNRPARVRVVTATQQGLNYSLTTFMTPEICETAQELGSILANQLSELNLSDPTFYRLPMPIFGTGALFQTQTSRIGGRLIVAYSPSTLQQELTFQLAVADCGTSCTA